MRLHGYACRAARRSQVKPSLSRAAKQLKDIMATSLVVRKNGSEPGGHSAVFVDLETRATQDDHQALRLWLRLLSCTVRVENHVRDGLRRDFSTTLPRFD